MKGEQIFVTLCCAFQSYAAVAYRTCVKCKRCDVLCCKSVAVSSDLGM